MYARPFDDGSYDPDGTIAKYEWDFAYGDSRDHTLTGGVTEYTCQSAYTCTAVLRPRGSVANRKIVAIPISEWQRTKRSAFPEKSAFIERTRRKQ